MSADGDDSTGEAPAGWYDDPQRPGKQRYWTGAAWAPLAGWYGDPERPGYRRWWDGQDWTQVRERVRRHSLKPPMPDPDQGQPRKRYWGDPPDEFKGWFGG